MLNHDVSLVLAFLGSARVDLTVSLARQLGIPVETVPADPTKPFVHDIEPAPINSVVVACPSDYQDPDKTLHRLRLDLPTTDMPITLITATPGVMIDAYLKRCPQLLSRIFKVDEPGLCSPPLPSDPHAAALLLLTRRLRSFLQHPGGLWPTPLFESVKPAKAKFAN